MPRASRKKHPFPAKEKVTKPKELFPSFYVCACGFQSDHFENTIRELKRLSLKRRQILEADDGEHQIIFEGGMMVAMWCPETGKEMAAGK